MKKESIAPMMLSIAFWIIVLSVVVTMSGCQTASVALDGAQAIRDGIAKKETEVHVRGLCSSNFDIIRDKFGKDDKSWRAILVLCGSGSNSLDRE